MAVLQKTLTPLRSGKKWKFEEKRHFDFKILKTRTFEHLYIAGIYNKKVSVRFLWFFSEVNLVKKSELTQQWRKDKKETSAQVHVNWFDVWNFWQCCICWSHQGCHGEHGGHTKANPSRGCTSVEPEWNPRDDNNEAWRNVDLDHVVAHWPYKLDFTSKSGVVS